MSAIQTISNFVYGAEESFQSVLVDRSINFEREAGFAIQVLTASDYIAKLASGDRQSVVNAVTNIAAIGISLNPAKKQAYLVPRKGKIYLDISYMGLIDLAVQAGSILWAQADIVYASDAFTLNGFDRPPTHSYNPFSRERGEMVGAYVVVKTPSGDYLTDCMSREEIDAIKNRSESVKAGKSSPWDTDYGEMAKKTVVKRAYKYWPKSDRLDQAIHHLNTEGGEGLATAQPVRAVAIDQQPIIDGARATKTVDELNAYWAEHNGKLANDLPAHDALKQACKAHKQRLQAQAAQQEATDVEAKNAVDQP
ncbi:DNA recombinase [Delftia acidovorans]|uniref:DNA recombinase n=1 Tax=Chryseobacterium sp. B5 TaxID=2050562 RepID=A0A2G7T865_9FLAO|nr:DNA recombinase [Delftia acidovorans]